MFFLTITSNANVYIIRLINGMGRILMVPCEHCVKVTLQLHDMTNSHYSIN